MMIKWGVIFSVIVLYSVLLFLPFTDLELVIKYKMPDGCSFSETDAERITDNIFLIAFIGYYVSVLLIIFVMEFFKRK